MEEKEKEETFSVSPPDSDTNSPPPVSAIALAPPPPQVSMNVNMNVAIDSSINATATPPAIASNGGGVAGNGGVGSSGKKKRGRPRKYDSDGNLRVKPFHQTLPSSGGGGLSSPERFSFSPPPPGGFNSNSKKSRRRPAGSGNWQVLASLGELFAKTAGGDFSADVITVYTGEDAAGKIMTFAEEGERGICILSANGAVSNVTIRQHGSSNAVLTYQGRFEILSLSGSLTVSANANGGVRNRSGGLSVSLASPDGRVIGGGVAGLLLAATPIQIVIGSFMQNGYKVQKRKHHRQHYNVKSQPKPEEKGLTMVSPSLLQHQQQQRYEFNSVNDIKIPNPTNNNVACWNGLDQRPSPDINLSALDVGQQSGVL